MSRLGDAMRRLALIDPYRDVVTVNRMVREAKVLVGCEHPKCQGHPDHARVLTAAHFTRESKYRTASGDAVHFADMCKGNGRGGTRYSWGTIVREADKCAVLCANCATWETAHEDLGHATEWDRYGYTMMGCCGEVTLDPDGHSCPATRFLTDCLA